MEEAVESQVVGSLDPTKADDETLCVYPRDVMEVASPLQVVQHQPPRRFYFEFVASESRASVESWSGDFWPYVGDLSVLSVQYYSISLQLSPHAFRACDACRGNPLRDGPHEDVS